MGCNTSSMGNDIAKMTGLARPPTNKTGSSVVKKKVEHASKTGVLSLTEHKLETVPRIVFEVLGGAASKLRTLDLSHNRLDKVPERWTFPKLTTCNMSKNKLTRLPELSASLKKLDASENRLTDIGSALTINLEELALAKNASLGDSMWPAIAELAKLSLLDVCGCGLRTLLDGPCALPSLIDIRADDNAIETVDLAAKAPSLRRLALERNRLAAAGLPSSLLRLPSLGHLDLKGNPLSKREFLAVPGCDEFMKRREEHRKKQGGEMADFGVCGLDDQ